MKTSVRLRGGALLGVAVLAAGLVLPTPAFAADDVKTDPVTLETGHIDAFNLVLNDDNSVRLVLKEDVTGSHVLRTPESVTLAVKSDAYVTGIAAAALPAGVPTNLYHLPLTQDHNLIWPGWDTQSVQSAYPGADTKIDVTVDGPGDVFLWTQGTWGTPASLLVGGGYAFPGTISQPYPAHTHANWAFSKPGTYTLTATARVTSSDGTKTSTSNTAKYTIVVAAVPDSVAVTGAEKPVDAGTQVTLKAAQSPSSSTFDTYAWETRASSSASWEKVSGATGSSLAVDAAEGAQYRVSVSGGKDYSSGTAVPVTVVSDPATISIRKEEEPEPNAPALSITGLSDHYHSGSPIELSVEAEPAVADGTYEWYVQRTDQTAAAKVDGVAGATLSLTAEQAYSGAKVTAKLIGANGAVRATSPVATVVVDDHGAGPLQEVTIAGLSDHYHTGGTATLTASVEPASVLNRYEWYVQKKGESAPVLVEGQNGASYSFPVTEDLADASVIATLTYDDGREYVASQPVVVTIDDHHDADDLSVSIATNRDADDYWVGQTARLTAEVTGETDASEYRWLVKEPGAADFVAAEGTTADYSFKPTLANSGVQVKVQLIHDGHVEAESGPVTITAQQRDAVTTLTVTTDKAVYAPGETVQFVGTQTPVTEHAHYHWYIKRQGEADFTWVDQSREKDLSLPVTLEEDGAQLVLRLFDETHALIAESAPQTLSVKTADDNGSVTEPGEKPSVAPTALDSAVLDSVRAGGISVSDTTPNAGDSITVKVGEGTDYAEAWVAAWLFSDPVLLGGDWAQASADGSIAVTIPAGTPDGAHRLAVADADGVLIGWAQLEIGATDPGTTDPGTTDPGTTDPGTTDPGTTDPGATDPGTTDPGTATKPGDTTPTDGTPVTTPVKSTATDATATLATTGGGDNSAFVIAASVMLLLGAATLVVSRRRRARGEADAE